MAENNKFDIRFAAKEVKDRLNAFIGEHQNVHICAYQEVKKKEPIAIIHIKRTEEEQT